MYGNIRLWLLTALLLTLVACTKSETQRRADSHTAPQRGGEATVLLYAEGSGSWPAGLDPATNYSGAVNLTMMNAIYGGLFQLTADPDGRNPKIAGVLAAGYEVQDGGRTILIHLRPGLKFSDGTPLDAAAVRANFERNLTSDCTCARTSWPWAKENRVEVIDPLSVAMHFAIPYAPVMNGFPVSNLNWIASLTALAQMGEEKFKMAPVGAGPFRVVSNQLSSRLVLERNPLYWQKDRPYLDRLIFQSIGNEQAAYQALLAGDAHALEAVESLALIQEALAAKRITVTLQPPVTPLVILLNTSSAPFNDKRAREAIYYATNAEAIHTGLFKNQYPVVQSFTAPGGLFYQAQVPGYRTYDLRKAKQIVTSLGGLRITLGATRSALTERLLTALQAQWHEAGIEATIETHDLGNVIRRFKEGQWQSMLQSCGSFDPDAGAGVGLRFRTKSIYSGVHDPTLEGLLDSALDKVEYEERNKAYGRAAQYISDQAYAPFVVAQSTAHFTRGLQGPGLTTKVPPILRTTSVLWQDVWIAGP